jgi:hypothetical protein
MNSNEENTQQDCLYETGSGDETTITKIEQNTESLRNRIKISKQLRDFLRENDKYEPYFLYMLEDPTQNSRNHLTISEIRGNKNLEKCEFPNRDSVSDYYLCRYKNVESKPIESYIRENLDLMIITDIHNLLLESIRKLYENTQIVNISINSETIMITKSGFPLITNYSFAFDNFAYKMTNGFIPDESKCLEIHILYYIEKSNSSANSSVFTERDLNEVYSKLNIEQHPPQEQMRSVYENKQYKEVYEMCIETMESWDIYSIMYLFWNILKKNVENMGDDLLLKKYKTTLHGFLISPPKERLNKNIFDKRIYLRE